jgi:hypothetical protein
MISAFHADPASENAGFIEPRARFARCFACFLAEISPVNQVARNELGLIVCLSTILAKCGWIDP